MADPDAMHQVFGNLMENALKYAQSGKRIRAGARLLASEVQFTIQDFGPGIASEHLERIFERFYRIDKARSRELGIKAYLNKPIRRFDLLRAIRMALSKPNPDEETPPTIAAKAVSANQTSLRLLLAEDCSSRRSKNHLLDARRAFSQ